VRRLRPPDIVLAVNDAAFAAFGSFGAEWLISVPNACLTPRSTHIAGGASGRWRRNKSLSVTRNVARRRGSRLSLSRRAGIFVRLQRIGLLGASTWWAQGGGMDLDEALTVVVSRDGDRLLRVGFQLSLFL